MAMRLKADGSGNVTLPFNKNRNYLACYGQADYTVTIDGVTFTVAGGTAFAPEPAPMNEITVVGATVVLEA